MHAAISSRRVVIVLASGIDFKLHAEIAQALSEEDRRGLAIIFVDCAVGADFLPTTSRKMPSNTSTKNRSQFLAVELNCSENDSFSIFLNISGWADTIALLEDSRKIVNARIAEIFRDLTNIHR